MHFGYHLSLFGDSGFESFLSVSRFTLRTKREVAMTAKFLAKTDLSMMGLLSEILPVCIEGY